MGLEVEHPTLSIILNDVFASNIGSERVSTKEIYGPRHPCSAPIGFMPEPDLASHLSFGDFRAPGSRQVVVRALEYNSSTSAMDLESPPKGPEKPARRRKRQKTHAPSSGDPRAPAVLLNNFNPRPREKP